MSADLQPVSCFFHCLIQLFQQSIPARGIETTNGPERQGVANNHHLPHEFHALMFRAMRSKYRS
jgi:hypothetical protein